MFSCKKGSAIKVEIGEDGIKSILVQSEVEDLDYVFDYFKKVIEYLNGDKKCPDENLYQ